MTDTSEHLDSADGADVVNQHWPYDGPHSADRVREAAAALPALVRYLNNATGPGSGQATVEYPATVDHVIGELQTATSGLDQLLSQLAGALEWQAAASATTDEYQQATDYMVPVYGAVYDDRGDRPGAQTAHTAAESIEDARTAAHSLAYWLSLVRDTTTHLGAT